MRSARFVVAVTAALSAALLVACSSGSADEVVSYHASYPSYGSVGDLLGAADVVVRGEPVSAETRKIFMKVSDDPDPAVNPQAGLSPEEIEQARQDSAVVVTVSTVKVGEVIKGDVKVGDTIEVSQLGGSLEGVRYQAEETTPLAENGDYVLFLAASEADPYQLLNPEQAMYTVSADGKLASAGSANPIKPGSVRNLKEVAAATR